MNIKKPLIIVILLMPMILDLQAQNRALDKADILVFPEDPPDHWPTYHLLHPGKIFRPFPADPNPAFYYKGRYHLHYIYFPTEDNNLAMAHVSSADMVHWKFHPTVLTPQILGHGMLSGTGFLTKEGKPAIIYSDRKRVLFVYAQDDNLDSWTEPQEINVTDKDGNPVQHSVWDPDCWLDGDTYYSIGGGKNPDIKKSTDLKNWEYLGHLMHGDFPKNLGVTMDDDVSCPNMFKISDKWMLLCISHAFGCRYYIGDFKEEKYLPESHNLMNWEDVNKPYQDVLRTYGTYFAPESVLTPDGRRVMWVWLFPSGERMQEGVQSLPRELELPEDQILRIKPLRELEALRYEEKGLAEIVLKNRVAYPLKEMSGDAVEFEIVFGPLETSYELNAASWFIPNKGGDTTEVGHIPHSYGIDVLCDEDGKNGVEIRLYPARKTLNIGGVAAPLDIPIDEETVLRVFIDKGIIEVFANDRQAMAYAHKRTHDQANHQLFSNQGSMPVKKVTAWKMQSAWGE